MKRSRFSEEQIIAVLRSGEWNTGERSVPTSGHQRSDVLQVEDEIRGHGNQRNASDASA
jgi:hypothetical protein